MKRDYSKWCSVALIAAIYSIAFLLWAFYTGTWSVPVILLLIASWYWGWQVSLHRKSFEKIN